PMQPLSARVGSINERSASTSRKDSPDEVVIVSVRRVTSNSGAPSVPSQTRASATSAKRSPLQQLEGMCCGAQTSALGQEYRGKPEMSGINRLGIAARDPELGAGAF